MSALAALTLVGTGMVTSLATAPEAEARFATSGTGTYRGAIDWFEWGAHGQTIPTAGTTRSNTRTVAGQDLVTTCRIGPVSGGSIYAYRSGSYSGDGLDDMYNIGGTGGSNQLVAGLATASSETSFSFSCSATLAGVPVPLAGLVMADAEASATSGGEFVQATIPAGSEWRLIDRYRSPGCSSSTPLTRTGQTLRMGGVSVGCPTYPTSVAFMQGATSANVVVRGGGVSAIALGVMLASDFGDAPASYGAAGSLYSTTFSGGVVPQGTSSAFALGLATPGQPTPRLGASVDSESAYQPSVGAGADGADEDAVGPLGTVMVRPGGDYTLPGIPCTGPGTVAGWVDWDRSGTFEADERSTLASCTGTSVNLAWTVPADAAPGATVVRLRIGPAGVATTGTPTGITTAGEVEDHPVTVALPTPSITKTSTATADSRPGDAVTYTVTATNRTAVDFTADYPAVVQDTLAGVLDDGAYQGDARASRDGSLTYAEPVLRWAGPLPAGQSVEITYTVTLGAGGDGVVRNVAWGGGGGGGDEPPECDPPGPDGRDPASGVPCAESETALPRLTIAKAASVSDLPTDGGIVEYTVRVTNAGPGTYTATAPATVTDDLSEVLDDAAYNSDASATTGEVSVDGSLLTWTGPLDPGQSATVTYSVTYDADADGDKVLRNSACVAADDALPGEPLCSSADVPGAALQQWKTADPASGTPVDPGQQLTYRLHLRNTGQAAATVDTVDDLTGVLDDATLTAVAGSAEGDVTVQQEGEGGTILRLTGSVPAGQTRTVTYTVQVLPWSEQGDHVLGNVFGAECPEDSSDCRTSHPVVGSDLGDAPAGYGTAGDGAARHRAPGYDAAARTAPLMLGAQLDLEDDGRPGAGAQGDDEDGSDDEDAVAAPIEVTTGTSTTVRVSATNETDQEATLAGWIDLDGDGAFTSAERVVVLVPAGSGTAPYELVFPAGSAVEDTFARLRLFPGDLTGDAELSASGPADAGEVEDHPVTVLTPSLAVAKSSDATGDSRPGDTVSYTVTATNVGTGAFTAENPAVVADDLTGLLDDATLDVASVDADRAGTLDAGVPTLSWAGALPVDGSVTLTYTVTLAGGGDGLVRNVAFASPCDPADPDCETVAPECDPPVDGADPETGLPCATTELELPRLSVTKTADTAELPAIGETVTYTVTVTNEGPGDYTAAAPATVTDDLAAVLDDATLDEGSITSSAGTATLDGAELAWTGVLASGESATVGYTFAYTGAGDQVLTNRACVPAAEVTPGAAPCAAVQVPGSGLQYGKVSDPASGTSVLPGQDVTYTLTFVNTGQAAAAVDATDDLADVLDDAALAGDPVVSDAALTAEVQGTDLSVTGTLPVGTTVTVIYTVTVLPWSEQGDHLLGNVVHDPGGVCTVGECGTEHPVPNLTVTKTSDATADTRPGDTITYTVTAQNTGTGAYTFTTPAVLLDDLAGVLDDATFDGDAAASVTGSLAYAEPLLSWSGALEVGQGVDLTYSVTLTGGGDGTVRNLAFAGPCQPDDADCETVTPHCDPPVDGIDPETGLSCATTELELPALSITKSADRTELPAIGESVTYLLTVANTGPGDYTATAPATAVDDLSEVLDDATLDGVTASVGTATVEETRLSWTGVLSSGDSATVAYTFTYTGAGDQVLTNEACVPADQVAQEAAPCASVQVPGSGLLYSKTSDPATGTPLLPGANVTYTLTFANTGQAAAAVDATDNLAGVLDDATVISGPTVSDEALAATLDGARLRITGSVEPGRTVTVVYTATVGGHDDGDDVLGNIVTDPGGTCGAASPEGSTTASCSTTHPVQHLTVTKASDAAADVNTGDTVRYTVRVINDGQSDFTTENPASVTDDLTDVLDDATYNDDATATSGDVSVAGGMLTWSGALPAGASVEIGYSVTVTSTGDHNLVNVAALPEELCGAEDDCTASVTTPLPHVVPAKTSDPAAGTPLQSGDVVTYTLTFTNDGLAAGPVDATDDLSGVLDDAVVTAEPTSDHAALTVTRTDDAVRVVGRLPAGESATVAYQVTIGPDGERGDNMATNVLTPDVPVLECAEGGCLPVEPPRTEHPIGELDDWKVVDPASGATVQPGREVTYTLHFTNTGEAPVTVDREDVLTGVLDDADLTAEPAASDDALAVSDLADGRFAVTGTLAPDETVTVSYTVVVRADGDRGDDSLGNFLVAPGTQPPAGCPADAAQEGDCTVNPVSDVTVVKSADPADGATVAVGDEVTYTLTFTNVSTNDDAAPAEVDYTDHMADVLDDADLTGAPQISGDALEAVAREETIRVAGALRPGQVVTVTYTVTVSEYDDQGDHSLANLIAMTGAEPVCVEGSGLCTTHPTAEPDEAQPALPGTGAAVAGLAGGAALLLLLGALLLTAVRRRRIAG